ncbi:MAG: hypothetical protein HZC28_16595 [Spirochaetes bacterium]|nr:hypothetical protein [Spirochaetota bacterium]
MKNGKKNIFARLAARDAVSPEKLIALAIIAAVAVGILYFILSARPKISDPEIRKISALFSDDQSASQYTFLSGAMTGMTNREKAAVRLGYFMNYMRVYTLPKNDSDALADILADNLLSAKMSNIAGDVRKAIAAKQNGMTNEYDRQCSAIETRMTNAFAAHQAAYQTGDALWHLNYIVQSRQTLLDPYAAVLNMNSNQRIIGIMSMYREYCAGTRVRAEVKALIRGYVAD